MVIVVLSSMFVTRTRHTLYIAGVNVVGTGGKTPLHKAVVGVNIQVNINFVCVCVCVCVCVLCNACFCVV